MKTVVFAALSLLFSPILSSANQETDHDSYSACIWGDPHFATYDGLLFDCQSIGDFTYAQSDGGFLLQGRQHQFGPNAASVVKALAVRETESGATVEVTSSGEYFLDGRYVDPWLGHKDNQVRLTKEAIHFKESGIKVDFRIRRVDIIQPAEFLEICVFVPKTYAENNNVVGLLGKADGDISNDLQTADGKEEQVTASLMDSSFPLKNDHCRNNWCIKDLADSLFSFDGGSGFQASCTDPDGETVDLDGACPEHVIRCNGNNACLMDSVVFGFEAGQASLQAQAAAEVGKACACGKTCASGICVDNQCQTCKEACSRPKNEECPMPLEDQNGKNPCQNTICSYTEIRLTTIVSIFPN